MPSVAAIYRYPVKGFAPGDRVPGFRFVDTPAIRPSALTLNDSRDSGGRLAEATTGLIFAADARSRREALEETETESAQPNALWVAYPKANGADINRDSMWPILAEYEMRPISQIAVDDNWSAIRFRALKPGEARP